MSYSNLIGSQNELSSNLANENVQIENNNLEARAVFNKKQKDSKDAILKLQDKVSTEGGKSEIVDGIPISEDDVAGIMGGKATYNMGKNIANLAKNGLTSTADVANIAEKSGKAQKVFKISSSAKAVLSPADVGFGKTADTTASDVVAAGKQIFKAPVTKTAVKTAAGETGAVADGVKSGLKAGESTLASTASDLIGKAGAGLSIASGLELGSKDLTGLSQGKGWNAFGSNTGERIGNILDLAGDVTSVVPGGEIIGGLIGLAGGAFSYFGESEANKKTNDDIAAKKKALAEANPPIPQSNAIHPSLSTLGIVSNVSHPVAQMILGSGSF